MSSGGLWSAGYYFGLGLVIAAHVGFGVLGSWLAFGVVMGGYGFLYRDSIRATNAWYERADHDAERLADE